MLDMSDREGVMTIWAESLPRTGGLQYTGGAISGLDRCICRLLRFPSRKSSNYFSFTGARG